MFGAFSNHWTVVVARCHLLPCLQLASRWKEEVLKISSLAALVKKIKPRK